jgi:hypothetical protein
MSTIQAFDYFTNLKQSILWQYENAINLVSLINQKQGWYDEYQSAFWIIWAQTVFDLTTANFFGSAVWAIILNVPEYVPIETPPPVQPTWGFNAYDPSYPDLENTYLNFENGNFIPYAPDVILNLEQQIFLLRLRYFQLTTLTNIAGLLSNDPPGLYSINTFLNYLCTNNFIGYTGTIYAIDNLDMTITYNFTADDFPLALFNVLQALDIFPRPAGVGILFTGLDD